MNASFMTSESKTRFNDGSVNLSDTKFSDVPSNYEAFIQARLRGARTEFKDEEELARLNSSSQLSLNNSTHSNLPAIPSSGISRTDSVMSDYFNKKIFGKKPVSSTTSQIHQKSNLDPSRTVVFKKGRLLDDGYFIIEFSYTKQYFCIAMFDIDTNDQYVRRLGADSAEMYFRQYDDDYDKLASHLQVKGGKIIIPKAKFTEEIKSEQKSRSPRENQLSADLSLSVIIEKEKIKKKVKPSSKSKANIAANSDIANTRVTPLKEYGYSKQSTGSKSNKSLQIRYNDTKTPGSRNVSFQATKSAYLFQTSGPKMPPPVYYTNDSFREKRGRMRNKIPAQMALQMRKKSHNAPYSILECYSGKLKIRDPMSIKDSI